LFYVGECGKINYRLAQDDRTGAGAPNKASPGVVLRAANYIQSLAGGKRTIIHSWQKSLIFD
jgi:hypothetical protein